MRRVDSPADRLEYRRTLGLVRLFGLPFFITGLSVFVSIAMGKLRTASGPPVGFGGLVGPISAALAFVAIGAAFLFYRRGITVDRSRRTIAVWWGVVFPLRTKRRPLEEFDRVQLTRVRTDDATWLFVELAGSGRTRFEVAALEDGDAAHRMAEEIGRFAGLRADVGGEETVQL